MSDVDQVTSLTQLTPSFFWLGDHFKVGATEESGILIQIVYGNIVLN
jgi:hypothetical protein